MNFAYTQVPDIAWKKVMGGSDVEAHGSSGVVTKFYGRWAAIDISQNDQVFIATASKSNDDYVSSNFAEEDVWVVSLNSSGDTLWTKVFGGASSDRALQVKALSSGGCVVVGYSYSDDGDFVSNNETGSNGYIARLDNNGNVLWFKMYGGTNFDYLYDIIETSDGYLMACGEAYSDDLDLQNYGADNNWLLKINPANGNIVFSKTLPGPDSASKDKFENLFRLNEISPGKIILTGYTTSDFLNFALDRISVFSVDLNGNLQWSTKIGATGAGDYGVGVVAGDNGNFYVLGKLNTKVGGAEQASDYYGGNGDFWLVKMNGQGTILWEKNYGGSDADIPYDIKKDKDGNLYLVGLTASNDYDASHSNFGKNDMWILKVNSQGDTIYTKRFGGNEEDFASGIALSKNGYSIYVAGATESTNGTFPVEYGLRDLVVLRLDYEYTPEYELKIQIAGQGTTTPSVGTYMYEEGKQISMKATPSPAWNFVNWTDDKGKVVSNNASFTFTMPSNDYVLIANFQIQTFQINATAGTNGNISPNGITNVEHGKSQNYTITPDVGYSIADVLVDGKSVGAVSTYTFSNVTTNHTIHADFAETIVDYTIVATAEANGTISPSGNVIVQQGKSQTFTITPNASYAIADVLVDGKSVGAVSTYTFSNVMANHTINADFAQIITYTLTLSIAPENAGKVFGEGQYAAGSEVKITAIPEEGYSFIQWYKGFSIFSTEAEYTFEMPAEDIELIAFFDSKVNVVDYSKEVNFSFYPNPAQTELNMQFDNNVVFVAITDVFGRIVETFKPNGNAIVYDVSNLANGIYFIQAHTNKHITTKKLIIN